jgi:hypothetical protein
VSIRKRKAAARDERAFYSYGGQDSAVQGQDRIRIQRSFGLLCHHLCERYHRFRTMGTRAEHGRALCTRSDLVRVREMSSRRAGSWDAVGPTDMSSRRLGEQHCHGVVTAQGCCSSSAIMFLGFSSCWTIQRHANHSLAGEGAQSSTLLRPFSCSSTCFLSSFFLSRNKLFVRFVSWENRDL